MSQAQSTETLEPDSYGLDDLRQDSESLKLSFTPTKAVHAPSVEPLPEAKQITKIDIKSSPDIATGERQVLGPGAQKESIPVPKIEPKLELETQRKTEPEPEVELETEREAAPELETETEPEPEHSPEPEPEPEPEPVPGNHANTELQATPLIFTLSVSIMSTCL